MHAIARLVETDPVSQRITGVGIQHHAQPRPLECLAVPAVSQFDVDLSVIDMGNVEWPLAVTRRFHVKTPVEFLEEIGGPLTLARQFQIVLGDALDLRAECLVARRHQANLLAAQDHLAMHRLARWPVRHHELLTDGVLHDLDYTVVELAAAVAAAMGLGEQSGQAVAVQHLGVAEFAAVVLDGAWAAAEGAQFAGFRKQQPVALDGLPHRFRPGLTHRRPGGLLAFRIGLCRQARNLALAEITF